MTNKNSKNTMIQAIIAYLLNSNINEVRSMYEMVNAAEVINRESNKTKKSTGSKPVKVNASVTVKTSKSTKSTNNFDRALYEATAKKLGVLKTKADGTTFVAKADRKAVYEAMGLK